MKLKIWATVVAVVILAVGCGAAAAPVDDSSVLGDKPQVTTGADAPAPPA